MTRVRWTEVRPAPHPEAGSPCARSSHGVSFVRGGSRLIVHGGERVARTPLDPDQATWAADLLWRQEGGGEGGGGAEEEWHWRPVIVSEGDSPPPRVAHAQAVVEGDGGGSAVYVFGGRMGVGMGERALNDLWVLDCSGEPGTERWAEVVPTTGGGSAPPEPRSFHKMIAVGTDLYVFGGCGASGRLADLHRFDTASGTWHDLGRSELLRGRGGANLLHLEGGKCLAVVAGFAGEETNDGHRFGLEGGGGWEDALMDGLKEMRPRSVCVSAYLPSLNAALIFGGEVDPSDRGHEGAGGFENDVLILDGESGALRDRVEPSIISAEWPEPRGWSNGAVRATAAGEALYVFGGLSGDDQNPRRLGDLWRCNVEV